MAVAGKRVPELLQDNSYEEYSKFGYSEDDFHRSDSDIHPNDEDNGKFVMLIMVMCGAWQHKFRFE